MPARILRNDICQEAAVSGPAKQNLGFFLILAAIICLAQITVDPWFKKKIFSNS